MAGMEKIEAQIIGVVGPMYGNQTFHLPPEPLKPFIPETDWDIEKPERAVVARESLLQEITTAFQTTRYAVITGTPGAGKTAAALQFAKNARPTYTHGFYINADNETTLQSGFDALAHRFNIPVQRTPDENGNLPEVRVRYRQLFDALAKLPRVLLILDNADNYPAFNPQYLPPAPLHILITSRDVRWRQYADADGKKVAFCAAPMLDNEEGATCLWVHANRDARDGQEYADARDLSERLGGLPLCLAQAGAYLGATGCTVGEYLEELSAEPMPYLKGEEQVLPVGYRYVYETVNLALKEAERRNAVAPLFLRYASYFAPDGILESFFTNDPEIWDSPLTACASKPASWRGLLTACASLSLITRQEAGTAFSLHRVIGEILQSGTAEEERREGLERIGASLVTACPPNDDRRWNKADAWLPHAAVSIEELMECTEQSVLNAVLYNQYAYELNQRGNYPAALPLYARALAIRERQLGADHPNTATSLNNLAGLYENTSNYAAALPLFERALAIRERQLGADHPDTATSLNNLAGLYKSMGNYAAVLPLLERALAIRERQLGTHHPDTAQSLNNLAALYESTGNYAAALPLLERALAIHERQLGADHPDTATSLNNLALLYESTGNYAAALPLLERALAICERQLGADHPNTATSLNNLAGLYESTSNYDAALPLYARALAIRERQLGADHPDTAQSLNNLAALYKSTGNYAAALPLYERALAIRERQLGADHPSTAQSCNNLAALYESTGNYAAVLPLLERALAICERQLGADHPNTAISLNNLAVYHANQGSWDEALPLMQRALEIRQQVLGNSHPDTQSSMQSFAGMLLASGAITQEQLDSIKDTVS